GSVDVDTMVRLIAALTITMLAGCSDYYRYPCQNPDNWEKDICKKPWCEISKSCPEHIFKEEAKKECK
ncbi:MAG: hypothetical protein EBX95_14025, partial [Acidimicrobiia bacterium]|nr:hypothetical protein [Acidimicrobiia bacterium]